MSKEQLLYLNQIKQNYGAGHFIQPTQAPKNDKGTT